MSKRLLRGMIGYKHKTFSWHLIGFLDGSNIESTVSFMPVRNPPLYCTLITSMAKKGHQTKQKTEDTMSLNYSCIYYAGGLELDGCR